MERRCDRQPQLASGTPPHSGRSVAATPRARLTYAGRNHCRKSPRPTYGHPPPRETSSRSCALDGTTPARSGVASSDASPAAAAHASKWPIFALSDVHCARCSTSEPRATELSTLARLHNDATAAPTYDVPTVILPGQKRSTMLLRAVDSPHNQSRTRSHHLDWIPERRTRAVCFQYRSIITTSHSI